LIDPLINCLVQAWHFSLFGHTAQMPDETDAKKILTVSPWRTGVHHCGTPSKCGWRLSSRTWNPVTCLWMKQLTWLTIVHSVDWCLRLKLRTP